MRKQYIVIGLFVMASCAHEKRMPVEQQPSKKITKGVKKKAAHRNVSMLKPIFEQVKWNEHKVYGSPLLQKYPLKNFAHDKRKKRVDFYKKIKPLSKNSIKEDFEKNKNLVMQHINQKMKISSSRLFSGMFKNLLAQCQPLKDRVITAKEDEILYREFKKNPKLARAHLHACMHAVKKNFYQFCCNRRALAIKLAERIRENLRMVEEAMPVFFKFGSAKLDKYGKNSIKTLRDILRQLYKNPLLDVKIYVKLTGHTDIKAAKEEENLALSKRRVEVVKKALKMPEYVVSIVGFGSSQPIRPQLQDPVCALNRRVHFRFVDVKISVKKSVCSKVICLGTE